MIAKDFNFLPQRYLSTAALSSIGRNSRTNFKSSIDKGQKPIELKIIILSGSTYIHGYKYFTFMYLSV